MKKFKFVIVLGLAFAFAAPSMAQGTTHDKIQKAFKGGGSGAGNSFADGTSRGFAGGGAGSSGGGYFEGGHVGNGLAGVEGVRTKGGEGVKPLLAEEHGTERKQYLSEAGTQHRTKGGNTSGGFLKIFGFINC